MPVFLSLDISGNIKWGGELNTGGKILTVVITQDRVIDRNLKRQFKNRFLYTYRLFLLT